MKKYIDAANKQNEEYFELKALELLSRDDKVSKASNELLFQQLTITPSEIMAKYPDYKAQPKQPEGGGVAPLQKFVPAQTFIQKERDSEELPRDY